MKGTNKEKKAKKGIQKISVKQFVLVLIIAILSVFSFCKTAEECKRILQIKEDIKQIEQIEKAVEEQIETEKVGENAIISSIEVSSRQTGTGIFDENDEPGNDSSADNNIVRSFDTISYAIDNTMQMKINEEEENPEFYKGGIIEIKAEIPEECKEIVKWKTEAMKWATNMQLSEDGRTIVAQYEMNKETVNIPGVAGLQFMLQVLDAPNGTPITPTFTSRLIGNSQEEEKTLTDDSVTVSAAPSYNIQLTKKKELNYKSYFDPDTKNEVEKPTENSIYGRMQGYAITLQLYNTNQDKKLKGIELPKGDITFDLALNEFDGTTDISQTKGYTPILWEYTENEQYQTGSKGNNLIWNQDESSGYGRQIAPYNSGGKKDSCFNGGSWEIKRDNGNQTLYHVTIKNYKFDKNNFQFPIKNAEDTNEMQEAYGENVGCFSAGYIQTIMQMPEIVDSIKNVGMQVEIANLKATSVSDQETKQDQKREDNISRESITLYPEGNYIKSNYFGNSEQIFRQDQNLASSITAGDASAYKGQGIYIVAGVQMGENNDQKIGAINVLQKFDDKAFIIPEDLNSTSGKKTGTKGNLKTLYAAKPDKTGWKDENEMQEAKEEDLIYFSSMLELKEVGYKCVGILFEDRDVEGKANDIYSYAIRTFISEDAEIGEVYQTVNNVTIWKEAHKFSWANQKYTYQEENGLIYEEIDCPEPLTIEYNGKNANTPKYVKTEYDENGKIKLGTHNGIRSGNSLTITGAELEIKKTSEKDRYYFSNWDVKDDNYEIEYKIASKLSNDIENENIKGVNIKIKDTLPKGITYKTGSSEYEEPEITLNEDGSTTLVWYFYNTMVNQTLPDICYTATIEENLLKNQEYTSYAEISEVINEGEKTKIGAIRTENRTTKHTITTRASGSYSFYQTTTTPRIETNGSIHYKIVAINNHNRDMENFKILDKLPKEKGEAIQLQKVEIKKKNIQNGQTVNNSNIKILTNIKESNESVRNDEFCEGEEWKTIQSEQNLPENTRVSEIGIKGIVEAYTQIEIDIYLKTNNNQAGDLYQNEAELGNFLGTLSTPKATVEVVSRTITGTIWEDYDRNGIRDYFEETIRNVQVELYDTMNTLVATTQTDEEGNYQFEKLANGNYKIKVIPPEGYSMTQKEVGNIAGINSRFNPQTNTTDTITLQVHTQLYNTIKKNVNAGLYRQRYQLHVTNYRAESEIKIKNAIYSITGNGIGQQGEFKTDKNGDFKVYLIPNETYIMKQTDISSYDYMLNEEPVIFKVKEVDGNLQLETENGMIKSSTIGETESNGIPNIYMEIENEPKYGIRITQFEKDTKNTIPYVRFRIKGKSMGEEGRVFQTNVNGIANCQGLELNQVYTIEEEYAKGYYYKGREFTIKMIRNNGKLEIEYQGVETKEAPYIEEREEKPVVELNFENENIPKYSLELSKIGEKTGKRLENAHFEIEGEGRDETAERQYTTDKDGNLTIEKLYENEIYTLKETMPPIGYKMKEDPLKFRATQENGVWNFELLEGEILEKAEIEGSKVKVKYEDELLFKLQKNDKETGEPLAGVKFTIKDLEGNEAKDLNGIPVGEIEEINGEQMRVVTTDENGFYTAEIEQGLYQIEEVQTIKGYDLPENTIQYFGIDASQERKEEAKEMWATEFATNNNDIIERVSITSDGGRVFGGQLGGKLSIGDSSIGDNSGEKKYVLVKYDKEGNLIWTTDFNYDYINYIKECQDKGLLVVGNQGIVKYKKEESGYSIEWESKVIKETMSTDVFSLRYIDETEDGGFVVAGQFQRTATLIDGPEMKTLKKTGRGNTDIFILKYKKTENGYQLEWDTTVYGSTTNYVFITSLMETSDGGILVGGVTNGDITLPNGETLTNTTTDDNTILLKYNKNETAEGYQFYWGKRIYGGRNRITGITETTDGEYVAGGYFTKSIQLSNLLELEGKGQLDNLVVKYDQYGNIRFGFGIGGPGNELVNHVDKMSDGGFVVVGSMASDVTLENGQEIKTKGDRDAIIIRYDKDAHVKWSKIYGGPSSDYFSCVHVNEEGRILLGTVFSSDTLELENGQILKGNEEAKSTDIDAALIEIKEIETQPQIPETREINYQNSKHLYQITTKVEGTGGNISGENETPYEQVKFTGNSEKDIIIKPKEGYEVSSVTINGEEIKFKRNDDGTVTLDKLINIQEDKEIVAKFTANPAEVIVHHYLLNTNRSIAPDEVIRGEVDKPYETKPKEDIEQYEVEKTEYPENAKGIMTEKTTEVFYYYSRRDAKVIIHHYLDGTNQKLAPDEQIEGRIGSEYETQKANIDGYEVIHEKLPLNSTGSMKEAETEVIYYYTKKAPRIIRNTILKNGTEIMQEEKQEVKYTLHYQAEVTDAIDNINITITDYLPFEIEEEKSDLQGGIYNQEEKTITWQETQENINTYQNGNKNIEITKNITLVFQNMDYSQKLFINYANAKIKVGEIERETGKIPAKTVTDFRKNVTVTKQWNHTNNHYTIPKTIRYQLKNGETIVTYKDLTQENQTQNPDIWRWEFTDLEKYDNRGNEIDYQVDEAEINEGDLAYYKKDINQENKTITNTFHGPIITSNKIAQTERGLNYVVEGEKITYTITVQNQGEMAKDIIVKDTIPEGTTFVEGSIKINNETTNYTQQDLANGITINVTDEQVVSFVAKVNNLPEETVETEIRNTAYIDEKPTITTENQVEKSDIKVRKESNPSHGEKVREGDKITYTINIQNKGGIYGDCRIKDNIPEGTKYVEESMKIDGQKVENTIQDLKEGIVLRIPEKEERSISFEVIVEKLEDRTKIKNVAYTAKIPDKVTNPDQIEIPDIPEEKDTPTNEIEHTYVEAIIEGSKTAQTEKGLNYVVEGEKITYTITAENLGGLKKQVVIKDTIPEGTTYVENSIKVNNETTNYTQENLAEGITVEVPEKQGEENGKAVISFLVTVNQLPEGRVEADIRNTAYIDEEPTPEETVNKVKKSVIRATKESNPSHGEKVKQGDKITYIIKLQNNGTLFGNCMVKDMIPEGTTFVEESIKINGQKVQKTAEDLAKGILVRVEQKEEATLSFEVTVNDINNMAKIKNVAHTTKIKDGSNTPEEEQPTNEVENTYIEPIITAVKTAQTEKQHNYVIEGEKIAYTITVKNSGGLEKQVAIKDKIPEGTTFVEGSIRINEEATEKTQAELENGIYINVADEVRLSFYVIVNSGTTGKIANKATVDDIPTNEISYPVVTFKKQVEIQKTQEESLPENTVTANDQLEYKIQVHNTGNMPTEKIEVKDYIPEGTILEQVNNGGILKDNREIIWNIETIHPGEVKELSFVVKVKYSKEEKQIKNIAYINNEPTNETSTNYQKTETKLTTSIEKIGDEQITSTDTNVYYEIHYRANIQDLKGKATYKIVDQLPYAIDEQKSDLAGGKYDPETKTITWEKTEEIDTYETNMEKVIQKTIAISVKYLYDDEENLSGKIENIVKATTQLKEPKTDKPQEEEVVKTEEKTSKQEGNIQIPTHITVHHYIYDQKGTTIPLVPDEQKVGKVGESYTTSKSNEIAKNYQCMDETPDGYAGKMTKTPIEVTYYYQLVDEVVTNQMAKTADYEVIEEEGNSIHYHINYQVTVKDYIGKIKVKIEDILPEQINLKQSNLAGGTYEEKTRTITWEETIENIDTFTNGIYTNTITKEIDILYEGKDKVKPLENKAKGSIITYYPEEHPSKPGEEKQTTQEEEKNVIEQNYKTDVIVEKVWDDNENLKKHRPNKIRIQLKANGQNIEDSKVLSKDNGWKHTFTNLEKYDTNGRLIDYTVEESEEQVGDLKYYKQSEMTETQEMTAKEITITNRYKLKDITIDRNINKEGTTQITRSNQEVNYHIVYQASIAEYIGDAIITVTDILPYQIDLEKSNLGNGTYHEENNTITWTETRKDIDTTLEGKVEIKIEDNIQLVYKDLNPKAIKMTNQLKGKVEFTEDDTKNEIETSHDTDININGKIKVKYIDKDTGKPLTKPSLETYDYEIEGKVGEKYKTIQPEIDTYVYLENTGKAEGEIEEGETEIIYYYTKAPSGGVTVRYLDEEGNEIKATEELTGKIGTPYKTMPKEIPNYELVKTSGDSPEGTMSKETKEINYHYKKIPAIVIVKYIEKETNQELAEEETINGYVGQNYKTQRKVITNYQKAEPEPANETGIMTKDIIEVVYYYQKIPSGKVTVKYVDVNTKEEISYLDENGKTQKYNYEISGYVGEKYETKEKEIPYYQYQENLQTMQKEGYYTQNNETIIYYYRKLKFNMSVNKEIKNATIDGNPIKIGKDNKIMKVELDKKKIATANLQITYQIQVSNTGELEGKTTIYEKIPEGLSILNKQLDNWKIQEDGTLYMDLDLKPGESRNFEITLQWKNGENNFGTQTNRVMIDKIDNIANFSETTLEDNQAEASVIINIKTGGTWKSFASILGSIVLAKGIIWFYKKKKTLC